MAAKDPSYSKSKPGSSGYDALSGPQRKEAQEKLLRNLASAVENLLIAQASQPPGTRIWDMYNGLYKVLELTQTVMKDGSMYNDFMGRPECRTFALEQSGKETALYGSCSIEGWLQMHLSNENLSMKLRDLYSDRERMGLFYTEDSITMNPVYRQTFLLIVEALEHMDLSRIGSLDLSFKPPSAEEDENPSQSSQSRTSQNQPDHNAASDRLCPPSFSSQSNQVHTKTSSVEGVGVSSEAESSSDGAGSTLTLRGNPGSSKLIHPAGPSRYLGAPFCSISGAEGSTQSLQIHPGGTEMQAEAAGGSNTGGSQSILSQQSHPGPSQGGEADSTAAAGSSLGVKKQHRRSVSCPIFKEDRIEDEKKVDGKEDTEYMNILEDLMNQHDDVDQPSKYKILTSTARKPKPFPKGHNRAASDSGMIWMEPRDLLSRSDELDSSQEIKGAWSTVVPATSGCHQKKPKANQSLVSYLSESGGDSSGRGRRAQLDRENAHFILSEAMIGTFEQMSFDSSMRSIDEQEESDEEIRELKEKLRLRREEVYNKEKRHKVKKNKRGKNVSGRILSDGKTDTGTTDQSGSTDYNSGDSVEFDQLLDSNDEEFSKFEPGSKDFLGTLRDIPEGSAESVALSLLGQVGAGRLPPADQLPWLVTEEDVPQQLLPLPDSLPVDPDEDLKGATELRGNLVWAPPRPQLVLTVQKSPSNRKAVMYTQRWQCAGCGMRVEEKYSKSFRFCNYLGKYFCTGCHENFLSIIPSRIIQEWDFKRYPVSNFSLDILNSMYTEPVFNIKDLNPDILRKVEKLKAVCKSRLQLNKLSRYIATCRFASNVQNKVSVYACVDPYLFSMEELYETRFNRMGQTLRSIVSDGLKHVQCCDLCQARAFICEGCHTGSTIFPFQTGVYECAKCFACFHKSCYSDQDCSRCKRIRVRQESGSKAAESPKIPELK